MLRVGLTGGLGSGKSTVAGMFLARGAQVIEADELAREMMRPGERIFGQIVEQFGSGVLRADGTLDRGLLARLAFGNGEGEGRLAELNAIVHPAVIARQAELAAALARQNPTAVLVVESALLFETEHAGDRGWRSRFDRVVLVTAAEEDKIERFARRTAAGEPVEGTAFEERRAEGRRRLAAQIGDDRKEPWADYVVRNEGSVEALEQQVTALWPVLLAEAVRSAQR